jgi:MoaA/NifB/PqqE/SkfB family radical SAM enzyme
MTTTEWQQIIDKAWGVGIPHIIFTGGEPTMRSDLVTLVRHAESNGQVTGLLSDGLKLNDPAYFNELLQSGLDHLLFLLQTNLEASWNALSAVLAADLFVVVHITISTKNETEISVLLERLASLGVTHLSLSASEEAVHDSLVTARNRAAELNLQLVWDIPVPYSASNPVTLELKSDFPQDISGMNWLYIEPDGDVMLTQGDTRLLGNILTDNWELIWSARLALLSVHPV